MKKSALSKLDFSKIASSVTGFERENCSIEVLGSQPINKGKGNLGVYKHILQAVRGGEKKEFCLIEKVTKRSFEVKIAKALHDGGSHHSMLPEIYDVLDRKNFSSIFMEFAPVLENRKPADIDDFFSKFVSSVSIFNEGFSFLGELFDYDEVYKKKHERLYELVGASFLEKELCDGVLNRVDFLFNHFGSKDLVVSHNDLAGPNIYLAHADADKFSFIDFGLVSPNFPGADFHHFVRGYLFRSRLRKVRRALNAYAVAGGYDRRAVAMSAYIYALHRSLTRLSRLEKKGNDRRVMKEARICQELASSLVQIKPNC